MEPWESVVASGLSEVGGGDGVKDSPSSTPSPSPTPSPPAASGAVGMPPPPLGMGMEIGMSMGVGVGMGSGGSKDLARKKRGRPWKYGPDRSSMALALSPTSSSSPFSPVGVDFSGKRGRGRPPGSGKRQLLAALGEWFAYSAGGNFTPHVVTVATGEDVASRILSFSQKGPRAICILSANGAISNVTLRQPGSSGGTLTYEGRFEILSLSGSFTVTETGGVRSRTGGISVSLAGPDGRVVGGGVAGLLLAASPIQVVVGSFLPNTFKEHRRKATPESTRLSPANIPTSTGVLTTARPISQATPDDDCEAPTSTVPAGQSRGDAENSMSNNPTNPNSSSLWTAAGWHGLQSSEHKPSPDINICLPAE
ncbi:AT-hook motif nuclear-localized protein 2 [Cocos nucifera]|uniref:AT-hook motif nuclear-localized protein n=1 Tax=Cocos nucifera TaxID=13894 RepID=A0A8K0NCU6_COCNU|nr:AT-hook motif nuclear-localized protein 2 [Cocos nucifera]